MKTLIKICFFLTFFVLNAQILMAQADALVITPEGNVNVANGKLQENGNDLLPKRAIIMWSDPAVPNGWVICNAENKIKHGTPDLTDRFIVGAGNNYRVTDNGGNNTVTLTIDQLPIHSHDVNIKTSENGNHIHDYEHTDPLGYEKQNERYGGSYWGPKRERWQTSQAGNHSHTVSGSTSNVGNGKSFDNRPPYFALYYIMKL